MPELSAFERLPATRLVSTEQAIEKLLVSPRWSSKVVVLRFAADEALLLGGQEQARTIIGELDPHAIVINDHSFAGAWFSEEEAADLLQRHCEWQPPAGRPAYAQGAVAGIPTKLWFAEDGRVLVVVQTVYLADFEERFR